MGILRTALAGMALLATTGTALADGTSYRADANASRDIDLSLCSSSVYVKVKGDGDTDLDFTIKDNRGNVVHRDFDSTDLTFVTLTPRVASGCVTYVLTVQNRGSVFNDFVVTLEDRGTAAPAAPVAAAGGKDRRIAIHNHTAEAFRGVFYSNTAEGKYGANRLTGGTLIRAGSNRTFDIDDGSGACHFDIKVETVSGRDYHKSDIDVCKESSVEFGTEFSH